MVTEKECLDLADQFKGSGSTFAEYIATLFKDKLIELYVGDSYENISLDQESSQYPAVFCGKVVGAYKECLIINAAYVKNKNLTFGNIMFVNERGIRALNEVDGNGLLKDMFLKSNDTLKILKLLEK